MCGKPFGGLILMKKIRLIYLKLKPDSGKGSKAKKSNIILHEDG